jgi:DNA-binding IclR family transcriptional regulator
MPRPSPASTRVVELLDFLADHADESFRLSEIARRVGFNKATAHGMLAVLAETGYLSYEDSDKTFRLGPTVVALGQAAVAEDSKLAIIALPELERLAETAGSQVVANVTQGDEFLVIASAGKPSGGRGAQVGYRGRMVPPIGMIYHAWASEARVDVWLDRISADGQERARYRTLLAIVHERGYSISADQEMRQRLDVALEELHNRASDPNLRTRLTALVSEIARGEHELMEVATDRSYRTRQISAPIFDAPGSVRMGLLLTGLPELPGSTLLEYAELTLESARRVTRLVSGTDAPADLG